MYIAHPPRENRKVWRKEDKRQISDTVVRKITAPTTHSLTHEYEMNIYWSYSVNQRIMKP